jgi:Tfp pilus assembly protein PilF
VTDTNDRMTKLQTMHQRAPDDTFLIYAIAMEHKKLGQLSQAIEWLGRVVEKDPTYCAAYHQAALTHEESGDLEAAKKWYRDGIAAAGRKGDTHTMGEMQAALAAIE